MSELTPFQAKAPGVMGQLITRLSLAEHQAAGILGNLGQESGLQAIQERHPRKGRGGFGWPQWTGSRRVAFEEYARKHDRPVTSDAINLAFMLEELHGPYAHVVRELRLCRTVEQAVRVFETHYEMAGVVAMASRVKFAEEALTLYRAHHGAPSLPPERPMPDTIPAVAAPVGPAPVPPPAAPGTPNPTTQVIDAICSKIVASVYPELIAKVPLLSLISEVQATALLEREVGAAVNAIIAQVWGAGAVAIEPAAVPPAAGVNLATVFSFAAHLVEHFIHPSA